jgi:surface antigen
MRRRSHGRGPRQAPTSRGVGGDRSNAATTLFLLAILAGCGDADGGDSKTPAAAAAADAVVRTAAVPADACAWLPAAEVASIVGPLAGEPVVVRSVEQPVPDPRGAACRYALAQAPRVGQNAVVLQVDLSGAVIQERVGASMAEGFRQTVQADMDAAGVAAPAAQTAPPGWDRVGKLWTGFNTFSGRIGHVAVQAASLTPEVPAERTAALATRVRDVIPDLPFPVPPDPDLERLARAAGVPLDAEPVGPDPCALLSPAEAEAVLGKLVVPPYRSAGDSPLALKSGSSCTYLTAGHRAFTIMPHWDSGKMLFGMAKGVGGVVGSVAPDDTAAAADTLEGPWQEAAANGSTGQMFFLKNDRMLEVMFVTSSTDRVGALRLARAAMGKL